MTLFSHNSLPARLLILFGLGCFLVPPPLYALDPAKSVYQYNLETWTRQNGLPINAIHSIAQAQDGYLWLGSQNGLVRFDGANFKLTAPPDLIGWRSKAVNILTASRRGGLWFGLESGTLGYFDGKNSYESFSGSWLTPQMTVRGIQESADGTLWIGSQTGAVSLPGGKTNQPVVAVPTIDIMSTYEDPQHRVWFGSVQRGLYYWQDGTLHPFAAPELQGALVFSIVTDQDGRLWLGTSSGLHCYDRAGKLTTTVPVYNEVRALLADRQGAIWIGTTGDGLIRYWNGQASWLRKTNGLANDNVTALCEDIEGNLWVGSRDGLTQVSDIKFPVLATDAGPFNQAVHGVYPARDGGLWCATSTGIYKYKDGTITNYFEGTNGDSAYTKRVLEARDGDVYVTTGGRQVLVLSSGKVMAALGNGDWTGALAEDSQGVVAAFGAGLFRVSRAGMTPYLYKDPTPVFNWVRNLDISADGALLVATVNGAFRIRDGRIEHWGTAEGLPDLDVGWFSEDDQGTLWVGQATGLSRIRNGKVTVIHNEMTDTLPYTIVPDHRGNLWISTLRGLVCASRQSLNDFADGKTQKIEERLYDSLESLKTMDLTEVESVAAESADGRIWLPGEQGVVQIDPAHLFTNSVPPRVFIESALVNGVETLGPAPGSVRPGKGELLFHYTAVSYIAPQKMRFRYQLDGYDADWIEAGSQRSALYANLKPAKYTFCVQACNADGVWNTVGARCEVVLPPHFYQTGPFQAALVLCLITAAFGVYRWWVGYLRHKEQKFRAANEALELKVRERTQELAEQRNLLRTLIDNLPDEIFVKDKAGRVIIDNLAHARALGVPDPAAAVGKTDFDCLPREQAEQFRQAELALLNSGQEYNGEEQITLPNGETRWLRTTEVPLRDNHGEITGLAGIHRDITDRKKWEAELESLHRQLVETSRQAGMAEVATSVLHNVGNALNSVNVSVTIVEEQVRASALGRLAKVIELLQKNSDDLAGFLTQDAQGAKLVGYLVLLNQTLNTEKSRVHAEIQSLVQNIEHIKRIVAMQQSHARVASLVEPVPPAELMDDTLKMHEATLRGHSVQLIRKYDEVPKIIGDRHKVIQILANLVINADHACSVNDRSNRIIVAAISQAGAGRIRLEVTDNGTGIPAENLARIFSFGYTTRKDGHGFGLHSSALAAKEMGGSLVAHSDGVGKGARFVLELPAEARPAPGAF